ncbi:hypothetical protein J3R30DRAFT_2088629 [Lentinula aciculospora]|uniref:BZIP domain-containing protein n=1 Tax=Lentinula aciculospora TaxID=153920 RepID=A0A9W8ZVS6_9AGAR|nr:hypothetical protein J3R30DRAFT_2088629 [Lentinula aciculospora]
MDSNMYSYARHYNSADLHDVPVASSSYHPQTAYLQSQSTRMSFSGPSHSSYIPEPQQDVQNSYISSESLSASHHILMDPSSVPHMRHQTTSSTSSASSTSHGTISMRRGSPSSPLSPDLPLPQGPRPRRSPASRHLALPDDIDDDSDDEPLPPNASERERSEWKKRRNTKAARRSRKRKMIYTERLEANVEKLRLEKEMWRTRALTLRQLLKSHNLPCPDFED